MLKIKEIKPKIGFIGELRQNILEDLDFAVKNDFRYYEIQALNEKEEINLKPETIKQAKRIAKSNDIYLNLHVSRLPAICSLNLKASKAALKLAKEEIILANKIGAKQITIHSGHKDAPEKETAVTKNFEILIKNLKEIVKFGRKYGIKIGLENSPVGFGLCVEAKDLLRVANSVKGLKITFDIGHANTTNFNPIDYFKRVKDFVIDMHIHDNDGTSDQHALIGEGNIDFKNLLRECKKSSYYGPFILEVFPHENVLKGKEIFLNIWNQI